ncbi:hypothetical protein C2U70_03635 [Bradyrhizobium guangdongense]|uniref:hypothetical protein n=1 Tax=Bradyrhizobium guangdongense TaxID=1325090 RepID=UPI00112C6243|nr:hypothetical protein [Bradyrhizobium guangdongense]TPQ41271.1 hypothetical protein C2U70_03635 [Bradyrhizobium guangdongense]
MRVTRSLLAPAATVVVALALALAVAVAVTHSTLAQSDKPAPAPQWPQQPQLPVSVEQALYLIRSTLLTLNDANRTGNYSVLRDLAAPDFQAKNTAADLALGFTDLRRRNFDLFSVALAAPQLSTPPFLDPGKMLRLTGYFPTRPLQINFDLTFQNVGNQWRLYGISVATPQAPPETAAATPPANAKKSASAPKP